MTSWFIHLEKDAWQVGLADGEPCPFPPKALTDQAERIAEALEQQGYQGEPVVLGLASDWCLAATVPIPSPQLLRRPEAMRYHLEDWIPWTAEEYVVDYVGHRQNAFMVAVGIEPLGPFLTALEELEIPVTVVAPTVVLAASEFLAAAVTDDLLLLVQDQDQINLITVKDRQIAKWSWSFWKRVIWAKQDNAFPLCENFVRKDRGNELPLSEKNSILRHLALTPGASRNG